MTGSTISSTSAAITSPPASIELPGPKPFRPGPRSPAWPLGHKSSCDRPSCALSRPEPIKLTVPRQARERIIGTRAGLELGLKALALAVVNPGPACRGFEPEQHRSLGAG